MLISLKRQSKLYQKVPREAIQVVTLEVTQVAILAVIPAETQEATRVVAQPL
jgi:hypothetical protein